MLLSCGGGGDGGGSSVAAGDQASGGIWLGSWTGPGGGEEAALAFSTDVDTDTGQARVNFFLLPSLIQIAGTAQVDGTLITGSGTAYTTVPGDSFPGGGTTTGVTFSGTLNERSTLEADWSIDAGESGSLSLEYDNQHTRGADLARLNGVWTLYDLDDNPMGTFDIMDGMIFRQTAVCTSTGTIAIPDPQFNIYAWAATITSNTPGSCFIEGEYTGLGALSDSNDESPVPLNDEFDVLVNSDTRAFPLILVIE
jgi:hypothetical protein